MPVISISYGSDMTAPLDSDLLRTFLAVADTGNVTRAADMVRRTQSAVSMQVRRLEDLIGRHVSLSGGERAELEALCERLVWR